jgi:hypothetical protein
MPIDYAQKLQALILCSFLLIVDLQTQIGHLWAAFNWYWVNLISLFGPATGLSLKDFNFQGQPMMEFELILRMFTQPHAEGVFLR